MVLGEEMNEDGSAKNPQQLLQRLQQVLPQLRNELPQLAEAVSAGDVDQMQALLRDKAKAQKDALQKQRELEQRIANDPFDVDAQKMLEEQIHQEQIQENMSAALEQMPEAFARVNMLWVKISVNNVPFKAFVDSGAQMSIMSKRAVDDANLSNLVDTRFSGVARGVGEQRIRGRVHQAPITVGETYLPCAIHVLDNQSIDVIFGLDMLMRHQCNIDLKHQKLIVGTTGAECAFLGEAEIPKDSPGNESTPHDEQQQQQRQSGAASSQQSPQQAPQTSHQQQQEVDAEKVARLAGLGFNEQQAREALKQAGGNVEIAAGLLFGG